MEDTQSQVENQDGSQGSPALRAPEHTPIPWLAGKVWLGSRHYFHITDKDGRAVAKMCDYASAQEKADRDFIVQAVNSHDALVMAVENARLDTFDLIGSVGQALNRIIEGTPSEVAEAKRMLARAVATLKRLHVSLAAPSSTEARK